MKKQYWAVPWNKSTNSAASGGDDFDPHCLEMIRNQRDLYGEEITVMHGIIGRLHQNLLTVLAERDQLWTEVRIVRGVQAAQRAEVDGRGR